MLALDIIPREEEREREKKLSSSLTLVVETRDHRGWFVATLTRGYIHIRIYTYKAMLFGLYIEPDAKQVNL